MDQCFTDLMDRGEQLNLPAIMIQHIARIANTTREHDPGYGFLLTLVFEHFGVELQKKVGVQVIDEIESSTLMGVDLIWLRVSIQAQNRGHKHPFPLFLVVLPAGPLLKHFSRNNTGCNLSLLT